MSSFNLRWMLVCINFQGLSLLDVAHGPSFIYEPPTRVLISNNSGGSVPCTAHGVPFPKISWLDSLEQPVIKIKGLREILPNGTLWFPPFSSRDYSSKIHEQEYRCVATNPAGTIVSRHSSVSAILTGFSYTLTVYNVNTEVGNTALLRCGGGREYIQITGWMRDNEELHTAGRILITTSGELHIKDVEKSDGRHEYRCRYKNTISGEQSVSKPGALQVTDPSGISLSRPDSANSVFRVKTGGSVDLPCLAQGFPPPKYAWYKVDPMTGNQDMLSASPSLFPRDTVLSIVGARNSDSGRYVCRISNQLTQFTVEHQLEVTTPLSAHVFPPYLVTDHGKTASFNCTIQGFPVLNVFWLKDGEMVIPSSRIRLTPSSLIIREISGPDAGMYQCLAVNEDQESQAAGQLVLGSLPPVFKHTFPKNTMHEGPKVSLRCEVTGSPPPTVTWYLDQQEVSLSNNRIPQFQRSSGFVERVLIGQYLTTGGIVVSHLNISSVFSSDGGLYRCVAKNSVGTIHHSARLNVYGPPLSRGTINQTAVAGGDVLLVCPVSGYPIHRVEWGVKDQLVQGPVPAPLNNGSLLLRSVEKKDGVQYTCTAYRDGEGSATAHILLSVIEAPKISPFAFDGDLKEGDRSQVSCTISSGDLPITIHWEKNGLPLESSKDVQVQANPFSSSIFFFDLKAEHSGSYTCLAENGADVSNFTAQLIVKVVPHWIVEPVNQTVQFRRTVEISCQAAGNPRPTISWRKSVGQDKSMYQYVQTSDGNLSFHPNGSLVIKSLRQSDEGFYRCEVQNGVGEISKEIYLDVQVPVYFDVRRVNRTAIVNQDAALICNPYGDGPIDVVWRIGEREISDQKPRFSTATAESADGIMNTLTIRDVRRTDGREYTCTASNQFGAQSLTVFLSVFEPPEPPSSLYVSEVSSRSATLSWYPAFDGNSPVIHYMVQYKQQADQWRKAVNQTINRDVSYARISGLKPDTFYQIRIISVNNIGLGLPSEVVAVSTKEEVPSGSPVAVRLEALSGSEIRVSWQPPNLEERNGKLLGYNVRFGEFNSQQLTKKTLRRAHMTELKITGLIPFTKYQVMVNAFNSVGAGPTSSRSIISTLESVPSSAPENVHCQPVSTSVLSVSWSPPDQRFRNGVILGYSVSYRRENMIAGKDAVKELRSNGLQISLRDLQTYTSYYVKIAAFTKVGKGVSSHRLVCTTGQDVPLAPEEVKAASVDRESILVSWKVNQIKLGEILSFTLFTQSDKDVTSTTVSADQTQFLLKGLRERQHYEFWITAKSIAGESGKSRIISSSPSNLSPARISTFSNSLHQVYGATVSLPCRSVGEPLPETIWFHKGRVVHSDDTFQVLPDGSLIIKSLTQYTDGLICRAENSLGEDQIRYTVDIISPPVAPSIRITRITSTSIGLSWNLPHNGGALIQGYYLQYKRKGLDWTEVSLDYDLLEYTMVDLPCGTTFSFNLVAHNIAGRSKPSATLTTPTKGSIPDKPDMESMISANITSLLLHLYGWPDGGCTIQYFAIEYREVSQSTWRVVSTNIRSEEEDILISDLSPATRYVIQLSAHNTAGTRVITFHVATLTLAGQTLLPWHSTTPPSLPGEVDGSLAIPVILSILIVATALLLSLYCLKRGRLGRYQGYPAAGSQYSVKSLGDLQSGNVHLYTPLTLKRLRQPETSPCPQKNDDATNTSANRGSSYDPVPYAVYRSPNVRVADKTMEYSPQFQTFGRAPDSSKSFSRNSSFTQSNSRAQELSSGYSSRTLDSSKPIIKRQNLHPSLARSSSNGLNLEISCISRQDPLPVPTVPSFPNLGKHRAQRYSLCSETDSNEEDTLNKFATLRRSRKYSSREASDLLSDSSTESTVEIMREKARMTRRNKRAKQARRCRSHSSLEDFGHSLSAITRLSTDSRELTEPECDRGILQFIRTSQENPQRKLENPVNPPRNLEETFIIRV